MDDRTILRKHLGANTTIAWEHVSGVQLQDSRTVIVGQRGQRISVDRYHPAYHEVTQWVLDQMTPLVIQDAGTRFVIDPYCVTGLGLFGLACAGGGLWLALSFGVSFWPSWATFGTGLMIVLTLASSPKTLEIHGDEIVIDGWVWKKVVKRSEVTKISTVRWPGANRGAVLIDMGDGRPTYVQMMHPGQFRLWLALTAWNRG